MTTPIKVDIWSDVQCPWCFIGKRKFESGVQLFGQQVEIEYHSFELAPDTPVDFEGTTLDYLAERKGLSPDHVRSMLENVTKIAGEVGLPFDFDRVHQTNTRKAHELLHYAKAHSKQIEMKERLLAAYFVEGQHVGDLGTLSRLAADVGLDEADVLRSLAANEYAEAVAADIAQAEVYGISGVPFYVIDGRFGISGAQSPETFAAALQQAVDTA
ncbi:MAG: DsbA family oxidoreductase [Aurantimicrobium sp.]|nr:DsbA family oxidoreductase [Aurantimicrobium sp.]